MKKILLVAVLGASVALSGCQSFKEHPLMSSAAVGLAAAGVAAAISNHSNDKDHGRGSRWDNDEHRDRSENQYHRHQRHGHQNDGNGVVYRNGQKGYLDSYGSFHAY